jgi:deazaflavin-dependent oxidoreductase (nitroreductase family)
LSTSASYARLETRGRKTNLPHVVDLRYLLLDGSFLVLAGSKDSDWVLNALKRGRAVVRVGEEVFEVSARYATEQERGAALEGFQKKYGRRFVDAWYGNAQACLCLTPTGPPTKRGSASGELSAKIDFHEWAKKRRDYYGEVAAAFDSASEEYDFTISHNFINTWIRRRSIGVLLKYAKPTDFLLEVGCGTGVEAITISSHVAHILATDISRSMVDLLEIKIRAKGLSGKITPLRLAASDISNARDSFVGRRLSLAYSFNGALNCEPKVEGFAAQLAGLLEDDGIFICSVRNTICLPEILSHAAALQFDRMNPRKKQPTMVSVGGRDIPSRYYSPGTFARLFRQHFKVKEVIALPGVLPPAYLNEYYLKLRNVTSAFERLDLALSGTFPVNRFGDQTLFVFQKAA